MEKRYYIYVFLDDTKPGEYIYSNMAKSKRVHSVRKSKPKNQSIIPIDDPNSSFPGVDSDDIILSIPNRKKAFALQGVKGGMQFKTANGNG